MVVRKNIAIIGAGYWGLNLVRNLNKLGVLKVVADTDLTKKKSLKFVMN